MKQYILYTAEEGKKTEYVALRMERGLFFILKREAESQGVDLSHLIRTKIRQTTEG